MRLVWDVETNGFLDDLTTIHCIAVQDVDKDTEPQIYGPQTVEEGIRLLMKADEIIGHNIINFDIPAIQKVYPWFSTDGVLVTDTLVLSRP